MQSTFNKSGFQDWLNERCPQNQLYEKNGVYSLPIDACERKWDFASKEFNFIWSTRNYKSSIYYYNNEIIISASIELVVAADGYFRTAVGCATLKASDYAPNFHLDAICKSFATVNASADYGDQFGRFLSQQERIPTGEVALKKSIKDSVRMKPDVAVMKQYNEAIIKKDQEAINKLVAIYDIKIG